MTPAAIHEILKMGRAIAVTDGTFLTIFWRSSGRARYWGKPGTQGWPEPRLVSSVLAHSPQYRSMSMISLPTSNRASAVAGCPQLLHAFGFVDWLSYSLIAEKILFIII